MPRSLTGLRSPRRRRATSSSTRCTSRGSTGYSRARRSSPTRRCRSFPAASVRRRAISSSRIVSCTARPPRLRAGTAIKVGPAAPASSLLAYYREAQRRFRVPWNVLASVNFVESRFGKLRNPSASGAQGPMQFMPATWARYGLGGNVHDAHDAILGAANYLHASGAPRGMRRALHAYNPSPAYVDAVLRYTRRMPARFYDLYNWQVSLKTPHGERRVPGPR